MIDTDLVKFLFAIYIVAVSLLRLMAEREFPRLTVMKRVWGRTQGLMIHFIANIVLPLLLALFYLCRSIAGASTF